MKVIFLDFDGVLNSQDFFKKLEGKIRNEEDEVRYWATMIDPDAVKILNTIVETTGAKIVVSSTWRLLNTLTRLREILCLKGFRFPEVIFDKTPNHVESGMRHRRGNQIQMWLNKHPEVEKYVIIDDDSDMEHLMHKLVKTSNYTGLQDEHIEPILEHLK